MTREEQIIKAADEYYLGQHFNDIKIFHFVNGAKWADKFPKNDVYRDTNGNIVSLEELEKRYKQGLEHFIDRACEWMRNIDFDFDYQYNDDDGYTFFNADKFIEDFCKAMEE